MQYSQDPPNTPQRDSAQRGSPAATRGLPETSGKQNKPCPRGRAAGSIHTKSEDSLSHSVAMAVRLLLLRQGQGCPGESSREPLGRLGIFSILIWVAIIFVQIRRAADPRLVLCVVIYLYLIKSSNEHIF